MAWLVNQGGVGKARVTSYVGTINLQIPVRLYTEDSTVWFPDILCSKFVR